MDLLSDISILIRTFRLHWQAMSKNILLDILRHASPTLRCSRFACWGHPNPRQKSLALFCEHALRRGFSVPSGHVFLRSAWRFCFIRFLHTADTNHVKIFLLSRLTIFCKMIMKGHPFIYFSRRVLAVAHRYAAHSSQKREKIMQ